MLDSVLGAGTRSIIDPILVPMLLTIYCSWVDVLDGDHCYRENEDREG